MKALSYCFCFVKSQLNNSFQIFFGLLIDFFKIDFFKEKGYRDARIVSDSIIINENFDESLKRINSILIAEGLKRTRQNKIQDMIKSLRDDLL